MKNLLEKIFTASDKTVVSFAAVVATLVSISTLAIAPLDEYPFEFTCMLLANALLLIEANRPEEEN